MSFLRFLLFSFNKEVMKVAKKRNSAQAKTLTTQQTRMTMATAPVIVKGSRINKKIKDFIDLQQVAKVRA